MVQVNSLKTKDKFKKTEIGEIPVDWEVCRLGEYAYIKARIGWRGLSASEYTDKGPLLIAGNHINGTKILWGKCDHISRFRYEESAEIKLQKNDVIISKDGTIGRLGFINDLPQEATIGGTMMLIRPNKKFFYPKYVYYYFQGRYFQNIIKAKVSGTSIPHIFQRDIVDLLVPMIPFKEQEKITEILSSIDEAIENSNKIIEKTEKLKNGLMQELLTKGIGHKKFKKTKIGKFPEEWKVIRIDEIVKISGGTTPSTAIKKYWEGGKILWATPTDITSLNGIYIYDTASKITQTAIDESSLNIYDPGTILLTSRATIGFAAITKYPIATNQGFINIVCSKRVNNLFLYYWINFKRKLFESLAQGSTFMELSKKDFRKIYISLPKVNEQNKIKDILFNMDNKIGIEKENKLKLEEQKKGLMQQLLTGKIRVNV